MKSKKIICLSFVVIFIFTVILIISIVINANKGFVQKNNGVDNYVEIVDDSEEYEEIINDIKKISGNKSVVTHAQNFKYSVPLKFLNVNPEIKKGDACTQLIEYLEDRNFADSNERVQIKLSNYQPDSPDYRVCYISNINWSHDITNTRAEVSDKMYYMMLSWNWGYTGDVFENITYLDLYVNTFQAGGFMQGELDLFKSFPNLKILDLTKFAFENDEDRQSILEKLKEVIPEDCEILLDNNIHYVN